LLAGLPARDIERLFDAANIVCDDKQLEQAQIRLANKVQQVLAQNVFPFLLGGGHEMAYGTFLGIARYLDRSLRSNRLLIINFDAHF